MLPHIQNSQAGRDKYDVLYKNIFEVYFTLPAALRDEFGQDEALLRRKPGNIQAQPQSLQRQNAVV